ncbi:MAG: zinc ribbon domain-containing protein [Dehalococcoidia bacterium]
MTPWWRRRFLWPRILYWTSIVFLVLGLLLAVIGDSDGTFVEDRDTREAGGALGFLALAGVLGGKYWMDAVTRARLVIACHTCAAPNEFDATFCRSCGTRLRTEAAAGVPSQG